MCVRILCVLNHMTVIVDSICTCENHARLNLHPVTDGSLVVMCMHVCVSLVHM